MTFGVEVEAGRKCEILTAICLHMNIAGVAVLQVLYMISVSSYLFRQIHEVFVIALEKSESFGLRDI